MEKHVAGDKRTNLQNFNLKMYYDRENEEQPHKRRVDHFSFTWDFKDYRIEQKYSKNFDLEDGLSLIIDLGPTEINENRDKRDSQQQQQQILVAPMFYFDSPINQHHSKVTKYVRLMMYDQNLRSCTDVHYTKLINRKQFEGLNKRNFMNNKFIHSGRSYTLKFYIHVYIHDTANDEIEPPIQAQDLMMKKILNAGFYDLKIIGKDKSFDVHKVVMATQSPYMKKVLEEDAAMSELKLEQYSADVMNVLVNYVYTQKLGTVPCDVPELLKVAHLFEIENLKTICVSKLIKKLDDTNCYDFYRLAHDLDISDLKKCAFQRLQSVLPLCNGKTLSDCLIDDPDTIEKIFQLFNQIEGLVNVPKKPQIPEIKVNDVKIDADDSAVDLESPKNVDVVDNFPIDGAGDGNAEDAQKDTEDVIIEEIVEEVVEKTEEKLEEKTEEKVDEKIDENAEGEIVITEEKIEEVVKTEEKVEEIETEGKISSLADGANDNKNETEKLEV